MVETATSGLFDNVNWDDIEAQEDIELEIPALKGNYRGEVKSFNLISGFNFYSLRVQITETVNGVKGDNRYVDRTFNLGESEWATEEEAQEKLFVALKTMGVKTPEEAVGKTICMKIRPNGEKRDKSGWPKHIVTIVKEFKGATDDANVAEGGDNKIPF